MVLIPTTNGVPYQKMSGCLHADAPVVYVNKCGCYVCEVSLEGRRIKSDSVMVKIVPHKEKYVLKMSEILFYPCIVATSGSTSESPMEDDHPDNAKPDNEAIKAESDNEAINAIGTFPST